MRISLPADHLFRRYGDVQSFISPILPEEDFFEASRLMRVRDFTIGILPFGYPAEAVLDPDSLRFPTQWSGIFFNYHERWVPFDGAKRFALDRAYLHFYLTPLDDLQAASLHCDPSLDRTEANFSYKRGPHLHIAGAIPDISRSHLSICASDNALGGNNLGSLTRTLKSGLSLIIDELIPKYCRHIEGLAA